MQSIKEQLGLGQSAADITEAIKIALDVALRGTMFEHGGLCSGCTLKPLPGHYFVAQEFSSDREDLRIALTAALEEFGVKPIYADDFIWKGHILCKISALIQSTPFGVYQLTRSQNRNVYLELGIAMGLGRPFVLIKEKDALESPLCRGLEYHPINSYLELRYELTEKMRPFLTEIARFQLPALPDSDSENAVIISPGDLEVPDFVITIARVAASRGLKSILVGDPAKGLEDYLKAERISYYVIGGSQQTRLNETVAAIKAARLGIYRIEKSAAPDAFIALGVSMALNRPALLVHKNGGDLPTDLRGISALSFGSYTGLLKSFPEKLDLVLNK